ncbi:MAG TPA: amino acid permease [Blastocatellia bacterium]|nr:amino acid permease [Blastocatellia bacterium]
MTATVEQQSLKRQLGIGSATALVVGEVIAVGIFLTPAGMSKLLGSPMWLLIVWLVMGAMALSGALCYGELAARFPRSGGGYVYLREAYGPRVAFLYGWKCLLVMDPGLTAALAVGLAGYVGYSIRLSPLGSKAVAIGAIAIVAGANVLGVRLGAWLLRWLTAAKLGLIGFLIVWSLALRLGDWSNFVPFVAQRPGSAPLHAALAGAMVAAFFSFGGWWDVTKIAGEVRNPSRTLPRALALGVVAVTLVYILTSTVFLYLVPAERVTSPDAFAAQAGEALFGRFGGQIFGCGVIVLVFGSLAALIIAAPRVYYAMASDGLFFHQAAALHPRFGTPARAIGLQAALASLLVMAGTFNEIIAYFIFVTVIFIAMTVAAVFILRRRESAASLPYRTPGYPITPLVFIALIALLLVLLGLNNPKQAFLGVGVVALGIPIYQLIFAKRREGQ